MLAQLLALLQIGVEIDVLSAEITFVDFNVGTNRVTNVIGIGIQLQIPIIDLAVTVTLPLTDSIEVPGAGTGPGETIVQKHDMQIETGTVAATVVSVEAVGVDALTLTLGLQATVEYCLVVAKEKILKVNGAETFC